MKTVISFRVLRFNALRFSGPERDFKHLAQPGLVFGHLTESRRTRGPR